MMNLGRVIGQARRRKTRLQPRNLRLLRLALSCHTVEAEDLKVVLEEPVLQQVLQELIQYFQQLHQQLVEEVVLDQLHQTQ